MAALDSSVIDLTGDLAPDVEIVTNSAQSADSKQKKRKRTKSTRSSLEAGEIETHATTKTVPETRDHLGGPSQKSPGKKRGGEAKERITSAAGSGSRDNSEEQPPKDGKKKHKKRPRKSREDPDAPSKLFFEDVNPSEIPDGQKPSISLRLSPPPPNPPPQPNTSEVKLLLPAHVEILPSLEGGVVPVEILPPSDSDSDSDAIEYLDYDDGKAAGTTRYFNDPGEEDNKPRKIICKRCNEEGHTKYNCSTLICLTCGVRNEHPTRSCPISKTCFSCGMKGHINAECPNRRRGYGARDQYDDCDRCGSSRHKANECPTLWRIYEYVTEETRATILHARQEKSAFSIGEGGEGYIATDEWCYNCGQSGHLGDDCEADHPHDCPAESSAFGRRSALLGPFADSSAPHPVNHDRGLRDWEQPDVAMDGWGRNAPTNVGRQGKKKDRARMEKRAKDAEEEDDEEDWFSRKNVKDRSAPSRNGAGGSGSRRQQQQQPKKMQIGWKDRDGGGGGGGGGKSRMELPPKPKMRLEERMSGGDSRNRRRDDRRDDRREERRDDRRDDRRDERRDERHRPYEDRSRDPQRDRWDHGAYREGGRRNGDERPPRRSDGKRKSEDGKRENGPRYKGGYS